MWDIHLLIWDSRPDIERGARCASDPSDRAGPLGEKGTWFDRERTAPRCRHLARLPKQAASTLGVVKTHVSTWDALLSDAKFKDYVLLFAEKRVLEVLRRKYAPQSSLDRRPDSPGA